MIRLLERPTPGYPCAYVIEDVDTGRRLGIQSDWDWPSLARDFGAPNNRRGVWGASSNSTQIRRAAEFLDSHWGEVAPDPGYFDPIKVDRKRFRFFHDHAGYVVGRRAIGAYQLARAEILAGELDWQATWFPDGDYDIRTELGEEEYQILVRWAEKEGRELEVLGCTLWNDEGEAIAGLYGIISPDATYRRVVEAELADEAFARLAGQKGS